jgi:hypothetical protein
MLNKHKEKGVKYNESATKTNWKLARRSTVMKVANLSGFGGKGKIVALMTILFLLAGSILLAGCGEETTDTGSELDGNENDNTTADIKDIESAGGLNLAGDDEVMAGYTWSNCVVEMTARYGDENTAVMVCEGLYTDHSDADVAQLETILAEVESNLGVTPDPTGGTTGGTGDTGGTGGTGNTGDGTGNNTGGGTSPNGGWSTEIIVPPAP